MIKKVKTYLNNAEIIEDENRLLDIVNQCEPSKIELIHFFFQEKSKKKF